MITPIIILFGVLILALLALGFFLDPPNPYLILTGSMVLMLLSYALIDEGMEVYSGSSLNLSTANNTITGSINHTYTTLTGLRFNSLNIVLLLFSLYLAYFSIDFIIKNKYGESDRY